MKENQWRKRKHLKLDNDDEEAWPPLDLKRTVQGTVSRTFYSKELSIKPCDLQWRNHHCQHMAWQGTRGKNTLELHLLPSSSLPPVPPSSHTPKKVRPPGNLLLVLHDFLVHGLWILSLSPLHKYVCSCVIGLLL